MNTFIFTPPPAHCFDPLPAMLNILFSQALTASCRSRYHCSLSKSPVRVRGRPTSLDTAFITTFTSGMAEK